MLQQVLKREPANQGLGINMKRQTPTKVLLITIIGLLLFVIFIQAVGADTLSYNFNNGTSDGWAANQGTWWVAYGEYHTSVGIIDNAITTISGANYNDSVIETQMRFANSSIGYRAGIVFRYLDNQHYYSFELGNQYHEIDLIKYSPTNPNYNETR